MPDFLSNRLGGETSPYLRQHRDNPVAWQPWDEAALAAARASGRPILLSIGYSACHWCHVMAHESFEDAAVAAAMNRLFVNIKVDREERPDLDQIYQTAHQLLTGRPGGWPLTMFLTPDGTPFFGGTYFPPAPRHGLPAFVPLCEKVAAAFRMHRDELETQNDALRAALEATLPQAGAAGNTDANPLAAARAMLLESLDRRWGGFGAAPKFPHASELGLLLDAPDPAARQAALLTLTRMAEGGLFDQVGGGFCRYSVDARWEIPHFEKMLYDNGQLLALYAEAWRQTGAALYARTASATAAWLMRELQSPEGGYYASLDADAGGEEGASYVWQPDGVRALLDDAQWRAVERHWGLDGPPNFENHAWHLRVAAPADDEAVVDGARAILLQSRQARVPPGRDEKILAAWNALAIGGMMRAARVCDRPEWAASARRALDFVRARLWRDGRLLAACTDGQARLPGYLDDHAFLLAALLEAMRTDFRASDLDWAVALAEALLTHFEDRERGGFFFTAHDHEPLIHRPKPGYDHALPSGNGVAAAALQRLGYLLGEPRYLDAAQRALALFRGQLAHPAGAALLLALAEQQEPPAVVLLRGPAPEVQDWQRRLARDWRGMVLALPNGMVLPPVLAKPESARATAWICSGAGCLAPVDGYSDLSRIILTLV